MHSALLTDLLVGLPALYELTPAEADSVARVVRTDFAWAFTPLALVMAAWIIAARLFLRSGRSE